MRPPPRSSGCRRRTPGGRAQLLLSSTISSWWSQRAYSSVGPTRLPASTQQVCAAVSTGAKVVSYSPGMPIYRLGDLVPQIHPEAFVHPEAVLIGNVTIGSESTVWPGAVLRGDFGTITVGERSSVQDGTVIHAGPGFPTVVGDGCVIGHLAHLEGCTMEDESL